MELSEGFPPLVGASARVLILGSLPGQKSLAEQEYYAHPRNAFWPIMRSVFDIEGDYAARCEGLKENAVAVWDVLQASHRPGSLDADIDLDTARENDFERLFNRYPTIDRILFNGRKAEQIFRRRVPPSVYDNMRIIGLPSTSPTFAAMPFSTKLEKWNDELSERRAIFHIENNA